MVAAARLFALTGKEMAMAPASLEVLPVLLAWVTPIAQRLIVLLLLARLVAIHWAPARPARQGKPKGTVPAIQEGA